MSTRDPAGNRARRGRGDGGVRQREDGRWEASISLGFKPDGKRRRVAAYGRTRKDAVDSLRIEQQRIASGLPPTDRRRTTGDFLRWWADAVLPGTVSPGSEETYRRHLELYLIPSLGRIALSSLAPADVTSMMRAMGKGDLSSRRPLSATTQNQARKVLSKALRRAQQEGLLIRNAASLADPPKMIRSEGRSMTVPQAGTLLELLEEQRMGVSYAMQLALGLRRGEVLGLTWDGVSLDEVPPVIRIRRQLRRDKSSGLVLANLKTPQSRRDLVLPDPVVAGLRRWRSKQSSERLVAGASWQDREGLVFTTPLGTAVDPDNYRHRLAKITENGGLGRWTTHELRHSTGSFLFAAGIPIRLISDLLGHSSERITSDIYVHTMQAARVQVASAMTSVLWASSADSAAGE